MTQDEYNSKSESFMKKAAATLAAVVLFIAGCTGIQAGHMPDDTSATDRDTIATHAKAYWSKDKEVEVTSLPLPDLGISEEENTQIDAVRTAIANTVLAIRRACLERNEFFIEYQGMSERYGCMSTKGVAKKETPNVFDAGQ